MDDGKSTLIGRLLHDSKMIYEDQLAAIEPRLDNASAPPAERSTWRCSSMACKAEREQGITIDVAYRYFSTARRKFIIADTPGHEQYTRNMATGASTCDLAIILVDARYGVLDPDQAPQLHRLAARHQAHRRGHQQDGPGRLLDKSVFEEIRADYLEFAERLDLKKAPWFIPISALKGDWVVDPGTNMTWFEGPTLMEHLETVPVTVPRTATCASRSSWCGART